MSLSKEAKLMHKAYLDLNFDKVKSIILSVDYQIESFILFRSLLVSVCILVPSKQRCDERDKMFFKKWYKKYWLEHSQIDSMIDSYTSKYLITDKLEYKGNMFYILPKMLFNYSMYRNRNPCPGLCTSLLSRLIDKGCIYSNEIDNDQIKQAMTNANELCESGDESWKQMRYNRLTYFISYLCEYTKKLPLEIKLENLDIYAPLIKECSEKIIINKSMISKECKNKISVDCFEKLSQYVYASKDEITSIEKFVRIITYKEFVFIVLEDDICRYYPRSLIYCEESGFIYSPPVIPLRGQQIKEQEHYAMTESFCTF
jgi:hypothetical protein